MDLNCYFPEIAEGITFFTVSNEFQVNLDLPISFFLSASILSFLSVD